jgi:hypothetical protein
MTFNENRIIVKAMYTRSLDLDTHLREFKCL